MLDQPVPLSIRLDHGRHFESETGGSYFTEIAYFHLFGCALRTYVKVNFVDHGDRCIFSRGVTVTNVKCGYGVQVAMPFAGYMQVRRSPRRVFLSLAPEKNLECEKTVIIAITLRHCLLDDHS
jgi:hypothetical protein